MAPPLVTKLPKVTEYVRNVGKSVQYATVDYFKGSMGETSDFIENNQELFKDIAAAVKDYKGTLKAADKSIRQSKIYEAGTELKKTLFESIRTGKFYDPEREAYYQSKASGSLGDMSDMDDWGFDTDQFDIDSGDMSQEDSTNLLSSTVKDATTAQANVIAKSSEYLAEVNKANTRLLFAQGEKTYAAVSGGFAGTQSMLDQINRFLQGPLTTHMENSKTFYEQTNKTLNEMSANLKELTEMQRNLYKREQKMAEQSQYSKVGSSPDLKEYASQLKKNFMEILGPEAQMVLGNDMGEGSNMLMALVANPLQGIPNFIVKSIVPITIKKSLETLDASFSNLFANFIARMNKAAGSDNIILQYLGRLFGLRVDKKTTYDSAKYEKGPVPFDGITKKTIVDIIPGHLARIEAALTGKTERVFDYETGKWTTAEKLEKDFRDRKRRNVRDAFWDSGEEARDNINRYKRSKDKAARNKGKELEKAYEILINQIYEDGGVFEPYKPYDKDTEAWEHFGLDKETFLLLANWMIGSADDVKKGKRKKSAYSIAPNVLEAQESFSRYLRDMENKGHGTVRHLYNNAYDFSEKTGSKTGTRFSNVINESFDKYGKNVFWYLRGIYAELQTIRQNSGYGGGRGRKGRRPNGPTSSGDPLKNIESQWDAEIKSAAERAKAEEEAKNTGTEDTDVSMLDREVQDQRDLNKGGAIGKKVNNFLDDLLKAGSLGQKFKVIQNGINELTKKPGLAIAGVIDQADKRIFNLLFGGKEGQEIVDKDGNRVKGFLDYMILKTRETFDKMNDWLDENILNPLKEKLGVKSFGELFKRMADRLGLTKAAGFVKDKVKQWSQPTVDRIKAKMGWGWGQFKGSMGRTYGAAWNKVKGYLPAPAPYQMSDEDIEDFLNRNGMGANIIPTAQGTTVSADDDEEDYSNYNFARGGLITRRGLAVVSPGEKVIPVGGKITQRNNLIAEKAFARRLGLPKGLSFYASGTKDATDEEIENAKKVVKQVTSEVMGDNKHKGIANVIASSLLGGGFSLLTGLIGGPLLGAAAGAAFGITQNSGTVQNMLFGEEIVDKDGNPTGERKGGLISADLQKKFKKYFPSMRDFGLAGAVAGLFTPFGLIGGLMAGSAIGFAKENEGFQEFLFGKKDEKGERDGGLIKKEFRDKVKKTAPKMLVGAIGGALLGPFGLLGNAVLGSALGFATTTNTFQEFVFGKDDGKGKKKGGLIPAIERGIIKPLLDTGAKFVAGAIDFFEQKIKKPVEEAVPAIVQMVKNGITGIGDHVKDFLGNMFERTIGRPVADFLEHTIFDNVRKWMGRLLKAPLALAKGIISAPFSALGFVGKNIRASQIAKGTAGDLTAQQRLDWRDQHRFRMLGKEIGGHDKYRNLDEKLANMQGQEGIDKMKDLRNQMNLYLSTRKELGKQAAELVTAAGELVSEFFNNTMCEDDPTKTLYQAVGSKRVKKIHEAIKDGKLEPIQRELAWMVAEGYLDSAKIPEFIQSLQNYIVRIIEIREKQKDAKKVQNDAMGELSKWSGGTLRKAKDIRRFSRLLDKEIDAREAQEAKERAEQEEAEAAEAAKPENIITNAINQANEELIKKFDTTTSILRIMNTNLMLLNGIDPEEALKSIEDVSPEFNSMKNAIRKARGLEVEEEKEGEEGTEEGKSESDSSDTASTGTSSSGGSTSSGEAKSSSTSATNDIINGDKKSAIDKVNEGYHTIETDEGEQGLVDSSGNVQSTRSGGKIKDYLRRLREDRENNKSFRERLNESLFGKAAKFVTNMIGGAKDGLFGLIGSALSKFEPAFNILKWAFLGTTAIAAIGHGTGWLEEKVFPFIRDKVGPWFIGQRNEEGVLIGGLRGLLLGNKTGEGGKYEDGLLSGIANKIAESPVGKFFSDINDRIKKAGGLVNWIKTDVMETIFNWYVEGIDKFIDKLLVPVVTAIVKRLPDIIAGVVKGAGKGIASWFGFGGDDKEKGGSTSYTTTNSKTGKKELVGIDSSKYKSSTSSGGTQFYTDNDGNAIWIDNNTGRYATQDSSGNYVYMDDGSAVADQGQFSLAKSTNYTRREDSSFLNAPAGIANNFLVSATGLRDGANAVSKTFGAKGIFKNLRKSVNILNPVGAGVNAASAAGKVTYNAVAGVGNKASSLGDKVRDWSYSMLGKQKPSEIRAAQAAQKAADKAASGGSIIDKLKYIITGKDPTAAASTAADAAEAAATAAADTATDAATAGAKSGGILSRIKSVATDIGSNLKTKVANSSVGQKASSLIEKAKGGIDNLVNAAKTKVTSSSVGKAVASTADDAAGFLSKIKNGILKFFNGIAENKTVTKLISGVAKIFGTSIDDVLVAKGFKTVGETFAKKIGENAAKSALKSAASALASIPIFTIALAVGYFVSGWNDAHTIFGIAKDIDIPVIYNVIAGLVNAVKNCLPGIGVILSFIDTSTIIDLFTDTLLPIFGWDNSNLQKLRQESEKYMEEWNANADEEDKVTSVEDYNKTAHPGLLTRISNSVKSIFGGGSSRKETTSKKTESGSNRLKEVDNKVKQSTKSGSRRRGFGHLYQGDPRLENVKFGNSTLGKAGCAPVAAANMMNGNLAYATKMAERYQTSDGGVTPDYFTNTLGGYQTDSKKSMLKAIKNGQQTVLLGNSGREQGTPFGANDHYITAKGMDRRGNIIVDDPDLPGSSYRYPASRVMRDTTTGVITGMRRGYARRHGMRRRYGFGPDSVGDVDAQKVSKLAVKGFSITRQFEGNYSSVNRNDNGALSVGRIQWHAERAYDLVKDVINAVGETTAVSILGQSLYNEVMNHDRSVWHSRTVSKAEAEKIGALISTEQGKKIQDSKACIEFDNYLTAGKNKGLRDENALCYYADLTNQGGSGGANRVLNAAKSLVGGSASAITLDAIHRAALADRVFSKYADRRNKCYNALKNSTLVGTSTMTTIDALPVDDGSISSYSTYYSSGDTTETSSTSGLAESVVSAVFGEDVLGLIKNLQSGLSGTSDYYSTGSIGSTGGGVTYVPANGYGVVGSPTQQGLVDQMASIKSKINYSLDWDKQDPDKGVASCASTVGWAYRKVLGLDNPRMSASSTDQSKDSRFTTIWTNPGSPFKDDSILQPGDVMYYNWDRTKNNGTMQHTEMYAGNGQDWSHGGNPQYGPVLKDLNDYRRKRLMMVRRYNGFIGQDQSGFSRRRGFARSMMSGVSASISDNAKRVISQYGISTSNQAPRYQSMEYTDGAAYNQFLAVIIDLLAAIADNTKGLQEFQQALNNRGVSVDSSVLEKAAANARRRAAKARQQNVGGYKPNITSATSFTSSDASDLMNSPTGFMVQAMEALASE